MYSPRGCAEHAIYENDRVKRFAEHLARARAGDRSALFAAGEQDLDDLKSQLRSMELRARDLGIAITDVEQRLYSGKIRNPKELEGMEKDLAMHKRQRTQMDDELLTLMEQVDQVQTRVDHERKTCQSLEGSRANDIQRLSAERDTVNERLLELATARERIRASLDSETLRAYDQLKRKAGRPIASVRHDSCGVCGVSMPTGLVQRVRAGDELVYCSGCGRILAA